MFRRILVPLDFSEKNQHALEVALELAEQNDSEVVLLHVIEVIEHVPRGELDTFYETLEKDARKRLADHATTFVEKGRKVRQQVAYGNRIKEIVSEAFQSKIDLLILSSHKIVAENPAEGWGTISYQAALVAPCPVLLVK